MKSPSSLLSTERFTGLAQLYAKCRPSYPDAAIDYLMQRCRLRPGSVAVDVGCGTGIRHGCWRSAACA